MPSIDDVKNDYNNGLISEFQLRSAFKPHFSTLQQLYPNVENISSCIYLYVNNLPESASYCNIGNRNRMFKSFSDGFLKFCGNQNSCACNRQNAVDKRNAKTDSQRQETVAKRKNTNLTKWGYEFASQHPIVKDKTASTCIDRYGTVSAMQNPLVQSKSIETCVKNNNVEYPSQNINIRNKTYETNLSTIGVKHPVQHAFIKQKMLDTVVKKYGVSHAMHDDDIKHKNKFNRKLSQYEIIIGARPSSVALFTADDYAAGETDRKWTWQCKVCNSIFLQEIIPGKDVRCYNCNPFRETWGEIEIKNFLNVNNINYVQNETTKIKPYQIDFFLPDYNIGIEFNGIYWHSTAVRQDKKYHFKKYDIATRNGIQLVQIFEHELAHKKAQVFSRLENLLKLTSNRLMARNCTVRPVDSKFARNFLNQNHLQGYQSAKWSYGLFVDDQIYAVCSITKSRFNRSASHELIRFATLSGYHVTGAFSKMLAYAQKDLGFNSIVSYASLSWGKGLVYERCGFLFHGYSAPNYWYFKNLNDIKSRMAFQKHKIANFAIGNSEAEIAKKLGYNRFYDAGNAIWIKNY